jgi:SAM-dependent methyltransferase
MQNSSLGQVEYSGRESLLRLEYSLARYNKWVVKSLFESIPRDVQASARVLDFGGGVGTLSQVFFAQSGNRADGVELDPVQRSVFASRGYDVFEQLPEQGQAYDIVFTSNVLEHIEDDVGTLKALRRALTSDGRLLIYVPAFQVLWTRMDDSVGHYRRYERQMLRQRLEAAGFEVLELRYKDSLGFLLSLLFKLMKSESGEPSARSLEIYDRWLLPISRVLDLFCSHLVGKNLLVVAKPKSGEGV